MTGAALRQRTSLNSAVKPVDSALKLMPCTGPASLKHSARLTCARNSAASPRSFTSLRSFQYEANAASAIAMLGKVSDGKAQFHSFGDAVLGWPRVCVVTGVCHGRKSARSGSATSYALLFTIASAKISKSGGQRGVTSLRGHHSRLDVAARAGPFGGRLRRIQLPGASQHSHCLINPQAHPIPAPSTAQQKNGGSYRKPRNCCYRRGSI